MAPIESINSRSDLSEEDAERIAVEVRAHRRGR